MSSEIIQARHPRRTLEKNLARIDRQITPDHECRRRAPSRPRLAPPHRRRICASSPSKGTTWPPTLAPGDRVIVDVSLQSPSPPGIFLLFDGIAFVAQRLEYIEVSAVPLVRVMSDNQRYQTHVRPCHDLRIVGRIRSRWQRL
jgi:hypothetical protein